eukprot:TRINITY_DN2884_c0_g1_i2.p1 TRINITY_DN2884_c0_g1~~TRINITY_DN2884_c0_g1_i2.p1  ORF type:complete len:389 (-),score=86.82 TRINITY_DN2884_c0_g1_i2:47-1213(-)
MDNLKTIFTEFEKSLAELSTSRKSIDSLTLFAINYKAYAEYIAKLILLRARRTAGTELAPFFLIDSITKREIPEYITQFSIYLADIFSLAFENGNKDIKNVLLRMYKTWDTYFPQECLRSISTRVRLPEIERLVLSAKDYEDIENFNKTRAPKLAARNASLYRRPPPRPPAEPAQRMIDPRPLIPATPPLPPAYPPNVPSRKPLYHQMPPQHVAAPIVSASDGPFAIIVKKFRVLAERTSSAPISFNSPGSLAQKNKVVFQSLYEDTVFQCRLCGMKNDRLQQLKDHLDRHFLANFLAMNDDKSVKSFAQTRPSFQPKDIWIKGIEQEELREVKQVHLIPYKEELKQCYACQYEFDVTYSQKYNDWVFTNAFEAVSYTHLTLPTICSV